MVVLLFDTAAQLVCVHLLIRAAFVLLIQTVDAGQQIFTSKVITLTRAARVCQSFCLSVSKSIIMSFHD